MSEQPAAEQVRAAFAAALEKELSDPGRAELRGAAFELSSRYRTARAKAGSAGLSHEQRRAYLATRLPATYAAARRVLSELASLRPGWVPASLLDLGAGPATATWAALEVFGPIAATVCVERDPEMAELGARLLGDAPAGLFAGTTWAVGDAARAELPESDLVIACYLLGELGADRAQAGIARWWQATRRELVLIEPGTPVGFERLRAARKLLIGLGANVTAPCPHEGACPMTGSDWCHFAVRLERSPLHRDLKGASLGYEDEKYAYLVVSPLSLAARQARLVRSPRRHKGHVRLVVCEDGGLHERVVSRRDGELYKQARASRWGDRLPLD